MIYANIMPGFLFLVNRKNVLSSQLFSGW